MEDDIRGNQRVQKLEYTVPSDDKKGTTMLYEPSEKRSYKNHSARYAYMALLGIDESKSTVDL